MRLVAGVGPGDGFVEFCLDRSWVGVCSDGLDVKDAQVMCSLLNFDPQGIYSKCVIQTCKYQCPALDAIIIDGPANTKYHPTFLTQVTCDGSQQDLNKCSFTLPNGQCTQAALSCDKSTTSEYKTPPSLSTNNGSNYVL